MKIVRAVCSVAIAATLVSAQDGVDLSAVHRIKAEAFNKGQVAQHLAKLSDEYGPRLTASPNYDAAADWAQSRFREWGLVNVRGEKWGPFGRSWALKNFSAHMVSPQYAPLIGFPPAWSSSTDGPVTAEPMLLPYRDNDITRFRAEIDRIRKQYAGKLRGKVLMVTTARDSSLLLQPLAKRFTDAELAAQALSPDPTVPREFDYSRLATPEDPELRTQFLRNAPPGFTEAFNQKRKELRIELQEFFRKEGVAGIFTTDNRGDGGAVFAESAGWYEAKYPLPLPTVTLTPEHYNRITRLLKNKVPVKVQFEVRAEISDKDKEPVNVIAEIPGGAKKDEIVIVGAHLDSWTGGTGATDNAAGSAVAMETVRILKALNLKLDRTVRVILWSGEEQGLLGSKAYVKEHLGDPETMKIVSGAHEKISAYFNLDNGSGKIRGVYLQGNDAARPVFERWLAPFRDLGVTTITNRNTGGTDHLSFDAVGIPGFQFIQDPLEYMSRTHHSNMDTVDHTQGPDLMQASAVMASVVYHAANAPSMMPRKPLPEPKKRWTPPAEGAEPSGN